MARSQNAPNGLFYKEKVQAVQLQTDSTVTLSAGATLPGSLTLSANTTAPAVTFSATSVLPGNVSGIAGFAVIDNATGQALAINTTGTTWKYLNVTSVQPT